MHILAPVLGRGSVYNVDGAARGYKHTHITRVIFLAEVVLPPHTHTHTRLCGITAEASALGWDFYLEWAGTAPQERGGHENEPFYARGGPFIHPSWGCRPLSQRQSQMFEFPCAVTREVQHTALPLLLLHF